MKTPAATTLVTGLIGITVAVLASSCADPYMNSSYGPTPHATVYRTGYEVRSLPPGYRTETISGTRYYVHNNTYYRSQSGRYVVVEAPRHSYPDRSPYNHRPDGRYPEDERSSGHGGHYLNHLPPGARIEMHDGERYYRVNNGFYQKRGDRYVQVNRPR